MSAVREAANRLRTALGWLDDNADRLPAGGISLSLYPTGTVTLSWHPGYGSDQDATAAALTQQLGEGAETQDACWTGTTWPAEGDRPELVVYQGLASRARPVVDTDDVDALLADDDAGLDLDASVSSSWAGALG